MSKKIDLGNATPEELEQWEALAPTPKDSEPDELDAVLYGFENECCWNSLGEAANEGASFLTHDEAKSALQAYTDRRVVEVLEDMRRKNRYYRGAAADYPKYCIPLDELDNRIASLKTKYATKEGKT